jgi:hypothetical protein
LRSSLREAPDLFVVSGDDGFWYVEQDDLHTDKKEVNGNPANPLIYLARPGRFERPTYGFVVRHSIQLSYGRTRNALSCNKLRLAKQGQKTGAVYTP